MQLRVVEDVTEKVREKILQDAIDGAYSFRDGPLTWPGTVAVRNRTALTRVLHFLPPPVVAGTMGVDHAWVDQARGQTLVSQACLQLLSARFRQLWQYS